MPCRTLFYRIHFSDQEKYIGRGTRRFNGRGATQRRKVLYKRGGGRGEGVSTNYAALLAVKTKSTTK